jgi:hypothetical protein
MDSYQHQDRVRFYLACAAECRALAEKPRARNKFVLLELAEGWENMSAELQARDPADVAPQFGDTRKPSAAAR